MNKFCYVPCVLVLTLCFFVPQKALSSVEFVAEKTAATLEDYLRERSKEESAAMDWPYEEQLTMPQPKDSNSTDYDALIKSLVEKVGDETVLYHDGNVLFTSPEPSFAWAKIFATFTAIPAIVAGFAATNNDPRAAKDILAIAAIPGMCAVVAAIKTMSNRTPVKTYALCDREALTYISSSKQDLATDSKKLIWSTVARVKFLRNITFNKQHDFFLIDTTIEFLDAQSNLLCKASDIYFPVERSKLVELVSFYRGKALSLPAYSLPVSILTTYKNVGNH